MKTQLHFRWLVLLLALAALAGPPGCSPHKGRPRPGADERLPRIETVQPARLTLNVSVDLAATVEPLEKADLCARVPGVVEWLPADIDIGRIVQAREPLVRLAVPDLEALKQQKEAVLAQARQQLEQTQGAREVAEREWREALEAEKRFAAEKRFRDLELARKAELAKRDVLARQLVDEVQLQADAAGAAWEASKAQVATRDAKRVLAEADLKVARARIDVASAELRQVQEQLEFAIVRAPFDGVVTKRWVDRGATIRDAATPLLTVMNTGTVRVLLDVPERHVPLVKIGRLVPGDEERDTVTLRIPALRDVVTSGEFTGVVARIAGALDPNTRTMRTEVHLDNRAGHLKPGMSGTATLQLEERRDALTLPSTALVRREGRAWVYFVDEISGDPPRGVVKRVEVELGLDDGRRVEVRNAHVFRGDERVIAKGNGVVREGDIVVPVPLRVGKE